MFQLRNVLQSQLFSNMVNMFILYGFGHIIPIILIPYLLNHVGVEGYGLINFILAFSFYFQVVNEYGFDLSNVSHVMRYRSDKEGLSKTFSSIIYCKLLLLLTTFSIYFAIIYIIDVERETLWLYLWGFVRLVGIAIAPYWLFRSMEEVKYITKIVIPVKTLCTIPIFFLVQTVDDLIWVMVCYAAIEIIAGMLAFIIALKHYSLRLKYVLWSDIIFYFKDSTPFFLSTALMRIYKNSNIVILKFFCGDYSAGIYAAAEKLHNAYSSFVSPLLNQVFYPYFVRIKNWVRINRLIIYISVLNLLLLACLYFMSPYVIPLIVENGGSEIAEYFNLFLLLLSISVVTDMIGFPYLGILASAKEVTKTTAWSALFYVLTVAFLVSIGRISVMSLILSLIFTTLICLLSRLYLIRKYKFIGFVK